MLHRLVNLTPHPVVLMIAPGVRETIPPSGAIARVQVERQATGLLPTGHRAEDGTEMAIAVYRTVPVAVEGLPEPDPDMDDGRLYLVSRIVAEAVPDRDDVFFPDELFRDAVGNVVGCRSLGTAARMRARYPKGA